MNITVNYYAQLRQAAGTETETIEIPDGTTVPDALRSVDHGEAFKTLLFDDAGALRPVILLVVNDLPAMPDRILNSGDSLSVFSPVAGG